MTDTAMRHLRIRTAVATAIAKGQVGTNHQFDPDTGEPLPPDTETTGELVLTNLGRGGSPVLRYRTGDLVRETETGDYEFIGRRDSQIKSRGYRIELGDIEAALLSHPDIVEGAVVPVPDDLVTNRIRACVVTRHGLTEDKIVPFLSDRRPKYMIPLGLPVEPEV